MAETELKVILKAKDLAEHGNCIKLCHSMDIFVEKLLESEE